MSVFNIADAGETPPPAQLMMLATAHFAARSLHMIANAGVADHVGETPRPVAEIAREADVDADALHRMLTLLAMHGVFRFENGGWAHTPASSLLARDHPLSMHALAAMMGDEGNWRSLGVLDHSLRTGRPAAEKINAKGIWGHYADHPDEARQFDAAMTAKSHGDIAMLVAALNLTGVKTVADIAGGRGHFLRAILEANPNVSGVLFDQPEVVAAAPDHPRQEKVCGDFFKSEMPKADLYLMTHIIHDWADRESVAILKNLRVAAPKGARLVLYELGMPEGPEPHPAKMLDIVMLTVTGGRERTAAQYAALFRNAGWSEDGVIATVGPMALHCARAG